MVIMSWRIFGGAGWRYLERNRQEGGVNNPANSGFTLIELLMAMAVFSLMLLIVVSGILNIMRVRNQTLAANATQDSARAAMNELVRAVRDSTSVEATSGVAGTLCLTKAGGSTAYYHVDPATKALLRESVCGATAGTVALTGSNVAVAQFNPVVEVDGPIKKALKITLTLESANGTANGSGACINDYSSRQFCSAVTITSGAVSR